MAQQPQIIYVEKKRGGCSRFLMIGVVGLVVLIGILYATGVSNPAPRTVTSQPTSAAIAPTVQANQPQATNTALPPAPAELAVGSTGEIDGVRVTLNEVRHEAEGIIPAKEGTEYVVVNVTIENGTDKNQTFSTLLSMSVKDDTGQKYTNAFGAKTSASPDGQVTPGDKIRGEVAYEVPKTSTGLRFIYAPFLNNEQLSFKLDR